MRAPLGVADDDARILVRVDPDGPGPLGFMGEDAVRLTPVALPFTEQTSDTINISGVNPVPNPSMILDDQGIFAPSRFRIDADGMAPTDYWANRETILTWAAEPGSPVTFVDSAGDEFTVRAAGTGEAVFYPEINGVRMTAPVIRAPIAPSRKVYVRVNIVTVVNQPTPKVDLEQEVDSMMQEMGVYWRQAGIRFVLEPVDPGYTPPQVAGATITQLVPGEGVFRIDITDTSIFDGIIDTVTPNDLAELGRVNQLHPASAGIVALSSVPVVAGAQGIAVPGVGTHTYNQEHHLLIPSADIAAFDAIWGGPGIMLDPDNINRAGVVGAHEAGHVMRLAHPDESNSPLLIDTKEFRNLITGNVLTTLSEDLLRRQGELARFSTFLQEDF